MPFSPESAFVACRFAHFLALMLLFGQSAFLAFLTPPTLRPSLQREGRHVLVVSAAVMALSALLMVPVEAAQMGNGWQDAPQPDAWRAVLETAFGQVWTWHLALSMGVLMVAIAVDRGPRQPEAHRLEYTRMMVLALASALLLASLGLVGHAAMHAGWRGIVQRLNHGTHLLSAGAWFGALLPLIGCLRRLTPVTGRNGHDGSDCDDRRAIGDATRAVRRFSTMGHVAVTVVMLTGVVNTALVLQGWPIHLHRPYEAMLDIKIVVVALMTAVAVYNRYRWVPAVRTRPDKALAALKRNTYIEIALGCAVLLLVAIFATDDPR